MRNFERKYNITTIKKNPVIGETYKTKGGCPEPFTITNIIIPRPKTSKFGPSVKFVNVMYEGIYVNRPHLGTCMIYAELVNTGYEKVQCKTGWWTKKS